jgi:peroxiredoxin Q/BCP
MMKNPLTILLTLLGLTAVQAADLAVGQAAPKFKTKTQAGEEFSLESRAGHWTVLYFYPKAETPGCTKQACAFRDNIKKIRDQGADVFGISADTVEAQKKFHDKHHLNFTLLADAKADIIKLYGTKMPVVGLSKRWTFVIDPDLVIRAIEKEVDPVKDADYVAKVITELKTKKNQEKL